MTITRAIILSAGQGSRLLPVTADLPKCLIPFAGRPLIAWQIAALAANGVEDIHVVTGFRTERVEAALAAQAAVAGPRITTHFNPFYKVADNLGSCWIARTAMDRDFLILNGDTLIDPAIVAKLLAEATAPITVTVDIKPAYDADDMKVERDGTRLKAIGKRLTPEQSNAESIGLLAFRGRGPALFRDRVEAMMRTPEGVLNWYLKAVHEIAQGDEVGTVSIAGHDWAEVDFTADLAIAGALAARWAAADQAGQAAFSAASSASRSAPSGT